MNFRKFVILFIIIILVIAVTSILFHKLFMAKMDAVDHSKNIYVNKNSYFDDQFERMSRIKLKRRNHFIYNSFGSLKQSSQPLKQRKAQNVAFPEKDRELNKIHYKVRRKRTNSYSFITHLESEYERCKMESVLPNECIMIFLKILNFAKEISDSVEIMKAIINRKNTISYRKAHFQLSSVVEQGLNATVYFHGDDLLSSTTSAIAMSSPIPSLIISTTLSPIQTTTVMHYVEVPNPTTKQIEIKKKFKPGIISWILDDRSQQLTLISQNMQKSNSSLITKSNLVEVEFPISYINISSYQRNYTSPEEAEAMKLFADHTHYTFEEYSTLHYSLSTSLAGITEANQGQNGTFQTTKNMQLLKHLLHHQPKKSFETNHKEEKHILESSRTSENMHTAAELWNILFNASAINSSMGEIFLKVKLGNNRRNNGALNLTFTNATGHKFHEIREQIADNSISIVSPDPTETFVPGKIRSSPKIQLNPPSIKKIPSRNNSEFSMLNCGSLDSIRNFPITGEAMKASATFFLIFNSRIPIYPIVLWFHIVPINKHIFNQGRISSTSLPVTNKYFDNFDKSVGAGNIFLHDGLATRSVLYSTSHDKSAVHFSQIGSVQNQMLQQSEHLRDQVGYNQYIHKYLSSNIVYDLFANLQDPLDRKKHFFPNPVTCCDGNKCVHNHVCWFNIWCKIHGSDRSDATPCICHHCHRINQKPICHRYAAGRGHKTDNEICCYCCYSFIFSCYEIDEEYKCHNRTAVLMCYV